MKLNKLLLQGKFFQLEIYGELQVAAPNSKKTGESPKRSQSLWSGCCCHLLIIGHSPKEPAANPCRPEPASPTSIWAPTLQRSKAGKYSHSPLCPVLLQCWERRKDGLRRKDWHFAFILPSGEPLHMSSKEPKATLQIGYALNSIKDNSSAGWVIPRKHTLNEGWVSAAATKAFWRVSLFPFYLAPQGHLNTLIQIGQRGFHFLQKTKTFRTKMKTRKCSHQIVKNMCFHPKPN